MSTAAVVVIKCRDPPFTLFRSRGELESRGQTLPDESEAPTLARVFRNLVCRVQRAPSGGSWVVALDQAALRAALSRNALRFVPFNFRAAQFPLYQLAKCDRFFEAREIGRSGIPQVWVYTPALWLLLTAELPNKEGESATPAAPDWRDIVVPAHYLYYWYRLVLLFISEVDFTSGVSDVMARRDPPEWATTADTVRALELWREQRRAMADSEAANHVRRALVLSTPLAYVTWRRLTSPTADELAECEREFATAYPTAVRDSSDPRRLVWSSPPASCGANTEVLAMRMVRAIPTAALPSLDAIGELAELAGDAEAVRRVHEYLASVPSTTTASAGAEEPLTPAQFAEMRRLEVASCRRQAASLGRMVERRRNMQTQYDLQVDRVFDRFTALSTRRMEDLRRHHAAAGAARDPTALFGYAVHMINVVEQIIMTLVRVPVPLRARFSTPVVPVRPEYVPSDMSSRCDEYARTVASAALEQRATVTGDTPPLDPERAVLPARVPDEMLRTCQTADDYMRVLYYVLDTWPEEPVPPPKEKPAEA